MSVFGLKPSSHLGRVFGVAPSPTSSHSSSRGAGGHGAEALGPSSVSGRGSLSNVLRLFVLCSRAPNGWVSRQLPASHVSTHLAGPQVSMPPAPRACPGHTCPDRDSPPPRVTAPSLFLSHLSQQCSSRLPGSGWPHGSGNPGRVKATQLTASSKSQTRPPNPGRVGVNDSFIPVPAAGTSECQLPATPRE